MKNDWEPVAALVLTSFLAQVSIQPIRGPQSRLVLLAHASNRLTIGAVYALQGVYAYELIDPGHLGTLLGIQQAVFAAGGALGPLTAGALLGATDTAARRAALARPAPGGGPQAYAWHATLSSPGADRAPGFLEASPG